MQADFDFNIPYRQQALARVVLPRPISERRRHGCHIFCMECFKSVFLGTAAFKVYLMVAWCVGLAGLMCLQKPDEKFQENNKAILTIICLIYLLAQISGLLAVVTRVEKLFIPYCAVLIITTFVNIIVLSLAFVEEISRNLPFQKNLTKLPEHTLIVSLVYFIYNGLCLTSVIHLCAHFDKKRILADRRRREEIAHRARIYNRLVELNERDRPVSINVDSPPKYSTLTNKSTICTPPPGYAQLKNLGIDDEDQLGQKSRRALFQETSSDEKQ
ncbi:hypothetical protein B9Z55_011474 [Caenorhabditis nigoni]|uniref:Uncharacterized protein n=1 Tax=Caenorhabditis nigoni TaxID=1611254 RepID=A0A2G5UK96_9PELO|nr:hypothetical protein B9Z55_011474 [Caenorhabditis nigoni]